jgi:hypothetical protein
MHSIRESLTMMQLVCAAKDLRMVVGGVVVGEGREKAK